MIEPIGVPIEDPGKVARVVKTVVKIATSKRALALGEMLLIALLKAVQAKRAARMIEGSNGNG